MLEFRKNVIQTGTVTLIKEHRVPDFDEDDGFITHIFPPGKYKYRVLDIRGFKPRQLKKGQEWIDVCGQIGELENILKERR